MGTPHSNSPCVCNGRRVRRLARSDFSAAASYGAADLTLIRQLVQQRQHGIQDTISLMDGAICRDAPAALPQIVGNNGQHNGRHSEIGGR